MSEGARELRVEVPGRPYTVFVGPGLLARAAELIPALPRAEVAALITDASVDALHGAVARGGLAGLGVRVEQLTLEPGERTKSPATVERAWRWLVEVGAHRGDLVVALGGGVVGDVAGFAAATYHRGIAWVQMPTTLLGQVDAAIGGKTGVDLPEGKNLVGAFHQPLVVIADTATLATLPAREYATGLAEVIKHGLIGPAALRERLEAGAGAILDRDPETTTAMVAEAAAVKVAVVSEDETEAGARAHLNYGHTLGHALEALGGYERWSHGEAVAIGMVFAAHLARELGYADHVAEHAKLLSAYGLPTGGASFSYEDVAVAWRRDKKYDHGNRFVVLEDLGRPAVVGDVPEDALRRAYEAVR